MVCFIQIPADHFIQDSDFNSTTQVLSYALKKLAFYLKRSSKSIMEIKRKMLPINVT